MSQNSQDRNEGKKPIDPRIIKALWVSLAIGIVVLALLVFVQWRVVDKISAVEAIRNIILALGGIGALFGVWVASIRGSDFAEQVKTQTRQTELQTQQTRSETLSRCVEQIGNEDSATIRTAGIVGLEFLAQDHRDDVRFLQHLCDILQNFLNEHAPYRRDDNADDIMTYLHNIEGSFSLFLKDLEKKAASQEGGLSKSEKEIIEWDEKWRDCKTAVEQAIRTFAVIVAFNPSILRNLDLSYRYLPGLNLAALNISKQNFHGAKFSDSFLPNASLEDADLSRAWFLNADLRGVHLLKTILREAELSLANLQETTFCEAKLENANFLRTKLAGATYYENESDYFKITGNGPSSPRKKVTPDWLKSQGAEDADKAIYSDDPKPKDSKK